MTEDTGGTATPPDATWLVECRVTLTEAEVERLTDLVTARYASAWGRARSWAVAAFLACWAAMEIYRRAVEQSRRRYRSQSWQSEGYAYTVAIRASGVHMAWQDSVTEMSWRGFSAAEAWGAFVVLWRGAGNPVAIPVQAVPPDCPAVGLVARCVACIEAARRV